MTDIIEEGGVCRGVVMQEQDGTSRAVRSAYTIVASGGIGGLYRHSTNFPHLTGDALEIASFVENLVGSNASASVLLPAILFLVAIFLSFSTGTSWGTFGILIPIVVASFQDTDPNLMIIAMSACMAGAVCGDHCSPISDTTIMASAGAKCNHINHVNTQMPYVMTVAVISAIGYVILGFTRNIWISLPVCVAITIVFLIIMRNRNKKKHPELFEEE